MKRLEILKNQLYDSPLKNPETKIDDILLVKNAELNGEILKQIKIVTMNNTKTLNALGQKFLSKIYETLVELDTDDETKVIILTGTGKSFAAGADIKKFAAVDYPYISKNDWDILPIENIYYHINKPVIAAINGIAFGGGLELALCCDILLASDKATLGLPEHKLGLIPGAGGTQRLARLMGYHKAMEYILSAKNLNLEDAKSFGVINNIVPHENLINEAIQMAKQMSQFSMNSILATKKSIKLSMETNLFSGLKAERFLFQGLFNTEDKKEGIDAFINKRRANFNDKSK